MSAFRLRVRGKRLVLLAAVLIGPLLAGQGAHADAALELKISAARSEFTIGEPIELSAQVVNRSDGTCRLAALADGTVQITSVTRDGRPVAGDYFHVTYGAGYQSLLEDRIRPAGPGKGVSFPLTEDSELAAVTPLPTGNAIGVRWPLDKPGRYAVVAAYRPPFSGGACEVAGGVARAEFTVAASSGTLIWWLAGGAAAIALAAAVLLWRRRSTGLAVVAVIAGTAVAGTWQPEPAMAQIDVFGPVGFEGQVNGCIDRLVAAGDPAHVIADAKKSTFPIAIKPVEGFGKTKGGPDGAVIIWDPNLKDAYPGDPDVVREPCSALYHELVHAFDFGHKQFRAGKCAEDGPAVADVRAVRAENLVRRKLGKGAAAEPRNNYTGKPLPDGKGLGVRDAVKDCAKRKKQQERERRKAARRPGKPGKPGRPGTGGKKGGKPGNTGEAGEAGNVPRKPRRGGGGSDGDPHLTTFDQRRYDFQAVGEFVLAKSGDLEVQVRQAPYEDSRLVSVNTAAGLRVGPDRLGFAVHGEGLRIHLNGEPATFGKAAARLPGGGWVISRGSEHTVVWPDGSEADVHPIGWWALRIMVYPADQHRGRLAGLLGDFDGDAGNDLVAEGGARLPDQPAHRQLYGGFADRWRITDADSLLPYPKGQDTSRFTDRTFHDKVATAATLDPARRSVARQLCQTLGIEDRLEDCVLDLGLTGQPAFAASAVITDDLVSEASAGDQPAGGSRVAPGGVMRDGDVADASIGTAGETHSYRLELGDATVFRLHDVTEPLTVELLGPDGSNSPGFTVTSNYQYRVAKGGAYTLKVSRPSSETGAYGFRLVTAKERRAPAKVGDQISGRLDVPGRVDLHVVAPNRPAQVYLADATGCELAIAMVEDSPAPRVYTPASPCSGLTLAAVEPGKRYVLIVWSSEGKTGDYSFQIATR